MRKLNFGMVGGGKGSFIGDSHRIGGELDNLARLTAGCFSRRAEVNKECAEEFDLAEDRIYTNYEEMAKAEGAREDGIDFVIIATPNDTHFPIAKCFMEQGIHVSCDKPVAMNATEARELRRIAKEKNLHFGVTYSYVNYPLVHQMRHMVETGVIGNVLTVMAEYPQDWVINALHNGAEVEKAWRFDKSQAGESAATADIGTHAESLIHATTGLEITEVIAMFSHFPEKMPLETNSQVMCKLNDKIPAHIWVSQIAYGKECSVGIRVFGDQGALEWNHDNPNLLKFTPADGPVQYYTPGRSFLAPHVQKMSRIAYGTPEAFYEAFATYYKAFIKEVQSIKGIGEKADYTHPDIDDGIRGLAFVEACVESNKNGNVWVKVNNSLE